MDDENLRMGHQQAWENCRYQDNLRWSRFQTVSVIEGAFLYAVYSGGLDALKSLIITVGGFLLVLIVSFLAIIDGRDAGYYFKYAKNLETAMELNSYKPPDVKDKLFRGKTLIWIAIVIINLLNVLALIDRLLLYRDT